MSGQKTWSGAIHGAADRPGPCPTVTDPDPLWIRCGCDIGSSPFRPRRARPRQARPGANRPITRRHCPSSFPTGMHFPHSSAQLRRPHLHFFFFISAARKAAKSLIPLSRLPPPSPSARKLWLSGSRSIPSLQGHFAVCVRSLPVSLQVPGRSLPSLIPNFQSWGTHQQCSSRVPRARRCGFLSFESVYLVTRVPN